MHHVLRPKEDEWSTTSDEFLSPAEVIERLQNEFEYVIVDMEAGRRHILERIEYLRSLLAAGKTEIWSEVHIKEEIIRLESLVTETYLVVISDCENPGDAYLRTAVSPGEVLFFGYSSDNQMEESAPLMERCAAALRYEIEEGG